MLGLQEIITSIKTMLDGSLRKPANIISGIILVCSLARRPGLSCLLSFGNVIQDIAKKGIPTEPLPDGTPNLMNQLVHSIICEVYRGIKEDANIQVAFPPGSIKVIANGANAGGPIVAEGDNINYPTGMGLMQ